MCAMLELSGVFVDVAGTGAEALSRVAANQYDGVILDVGLPDGDGVGFFAEIARMEPDLPVVFSTGHADEGALTAVLQRPNVRFIRKPYAVGRLLELFSEMAMAEG